MKYILFLFCIFYGNFLFSKEINYFLVCFNDFIKTIDYIKKYYVNYIRYDELFLGAIRGLLSFLDVHSMFFSKDDIDKLKLLSVG